MKKFQKILSLLLILCLFASVLQGCSFDSADGENQGSSDETKDAGDKGQSTDTPTIEEQVLLDQDGIKITAKEYVVDSIWGDGIKLQLENNTDKSLTISYKAVMVNDYCVSCLFYCTIEAGKKANETLSFTSSELEAAGIESIGKIEIYFYAIDNDTYEEVMVSDCITIQTSCYGQDNNTALDTSNVLLEHDGIKICYLSIDHDTLYGTEILLYVENNSDRNISISSESLSVNGYMMNAIFYSDVYSGKKSVSAITLFTDSLEENGIDMVENVEISFWLYDTTTYESILHADPIEFSVN